ncbi:MAG: hypothetical protein IJD22_02215 [Clostridia bacterium]|nr:hypothetical protein [Clostridia bacterium]
MKIIEMCIKAAAVLVIIGATAASVGISELKALEARGAVEHPLPKEMEPQANYAIAEIEKRILDKRKRSIIARKNGEIPFLVKGIKYNCLQREGQLVFYNSNQEMVYDLAKDRCIFYSYSCDIGVGKYSVGECCRFARASVATAYNGSVTPGINECICVFADDGICSFRLKLSREGEEDISVSIRRDTGKVILFDACGEQVE